MKKKTIKQDCICGHSIKEHMLGRKILNSNAECILTCYRCAEKDQKLYFKRMGLIEVV